MTNRSSSKQHGLVGNKRPKSRLRKRRNKQLAHQRKAALREVMAVGLSKPEKKPSAKVKKSVSVEGEKISQSV